MSKGRLRKHESTPRAGKEWLPRAEWGSAILLTLLALAFHAGFMTQAGALWRDEVNSVEFATMPSLSSLYHSLQYDSFPLLSTLLLRGWAALGLGHADWGFRLFGLLIGVTFIGVLWIVCRLLGCPAPLLSLALVGLNPWVIRAVDSVRPYGLGVILIVLTLGLMWRALESTSPRRFLAAGALAVLSVQCMYQNAFLLLGIGLAVMLVALRASRPRAVGGVVGVGIAAALSLLAYTASISAARNWSVVVQTPSSWKQILAVLAEAVGSGGAMMRWVWLGLATLCCAVGVLSLRDGTTPRLPREKSTLPLFSAAVVLAGSLVFLAAIKISQLPTQPWYYVPLAALLAPAVEVGGWLTARRRAWRIGRLALALLIAATTALPAWRQVTERRTNVDAVASYLQREASAGDAIVVFPFYFGVSFQRYYRGASPWMTIPPIQELRITRYDLFKAALARSDPMEPVLGAMERSLSSGHRVWLVGGLPEPAMNQPAPSIPPAPHPTYGWFGQPYLIAWGQQGSHFLTTHALRLENVPTLGPSSVSPYEHIPLVVASGWR